MQDNKILQQSLEKELALLEELNSLSLLKKDVLLKDDLEALEIIVLKEEALTIKLKTISDDCLPQVQFFLKGKKKLPAELAELVTKIRKTGIKFRLNNELNQNLIHDSLTLIQFTLNSFRSMFDNGTPGIYGSSGRVDQKKIHLLDAKG
jgi:hypothetical protein